MSKTDVIADWIGPSGRSPVLPETEIIRLSSLVQNPEVPTHRKESAVKKLVQHNLLLVAKITISFLTKRSLYNPSDDRISDYLQQGTLGLIRAAEKFDPARGYKFSTYAHNWIRCYLTRYHYTTIGPVHIPENVVIAMFNPDLKKHNDLVTAANRFRKVDSLDRIVTTHDYGSVCLGDIIDERGLAVVY